MRNTKIIQLETCDVELYDCLSMREKVTWGKETQKRVKYDGKGDDKGSIEFDMSAVIEANLAILHTLIVSITNKDGSKVAGNFVDYLMDNTTDGDKVLAEVGDMAMEAFSPNVGRGSTK